MGLGLTQNIGGDFVQSALRFGLPFLERSGYGRTPGAPNPRSSRSPTGAGRRFSQGEQEAAGTSSDFVLPNPRSLSVNDVFLGEGGYLGDEFRRFGATREHDDRLLSNIDDYKSDLDTAKGKQEGAENSWVDALRRGEGAIGGAMTSIQTEKRLANATALEAIREAKGAVKDFLKYAQGYAESVGTMRGEVLGNAKNQAATMLADASMAVTEQTSTMIDETIAEMEAMGVPQAQIASQVAQMAAGGQKQLGDMLRTISANENMRISDLEVRTGQWVSDLRTATTSTLGGVISKASEGVTGTLANLSQTRAALADVEADLVDQANDWRAGMVTARSELSAMYGKLALGGRVDLANMLNAVSDPYIQMGDILEGAMGFDLGLEQQEYLGDLTEYDIEAAKNAGFWQRLYDGTDFFAGQQDARHAEQFQENQAQQAGALALGGQAVRGVAGGLAGRSFRSSFSGGGGYGGGSNPDGSLAS